MAESNQKPKGKGYISIDTDFWYRMGWEKQGMVGRTEGCAAWMGVKKYIRKDQKFKVNLGYIVI